MPCQYPGTTKMLELMLPNDDGDEPGPQGRRLNEVRMSFPCSGDSKQLQHRCLHPLVLFSTAAPCSMLNS